MNHTAQSALDGILKHVEGAYAPNTLRAYRADMEEFIRYCEEHDQNALKSAGTPCASAVRKIFCLKAPVCRRSWSRVAGSNRIPSCGMLSGCEDTFI